MNKVKRGIFTAAVFAGLVLAALEGATAHAPGAPGGYGYVGPDLVYTSDAGDRTWFCDLAGTVYPVVDLPETGPLTGCAYARSLGK